VKKIYPLFLGLLLVTNLVYLETTEAANKAKQMRYEEITLKGSDAAFFQGNKEQAVIFVPGYVFNKESWYFITERLQQKNISSLALDGKSPSAIITALAFLKSKGFEKFVLVGGSMGGGAILSIIEKNINEKINKVIVLAPSNGQPIKKQDIKKLFIVAKEDRLGLYPTVQKLYDASSEPKMIKIFSGSEHAQHLFKGQHKEALSNLLIDFIVND